MQARFISPMCCVATLLAPGVVSACDGAEGRLQLQLNHFAEQARWPGQTPDKTTGRAALQLSCLLPTGADSGIDIDVYGDYDSAAAESWFDPRNLHYYVDLDQMTFAAGYQQKPVGHLEAEQINNLYNPKSYRRGLFDSRSQGRFSVGAIYRRESWLLHADLMPLKQVEEWAGEKGRFRRGGFVASDEEYARGSDVSAQLRWDYFSGNWELSGILWHGLSPQSLVRPSAEEPGALIDYYERIDQAGFSALYLLDNLSLKADVYFRSSPQRQLIGAAAGLAWQTYGLFGSRADSNLFLESYYLQEQSADDDGSGGNLPSSFDRDLYAGGRINFNDNANSELEAGVVADVKLGSLSGYLQLTRSLLPQLEYEAGLQWFSTDSRDIALSGFENDSHIYFKLVWYL
ncbi:hypothetical protein [Microbulbifer rhizosphaerae]|uniref:Alginate export domain-containing protein n=1 Tax=Microbulbifer rhizosphaerae TaxID=1562603 RepID=A0A7W4WC29_9GAMM|nr:hypothetical protein [Microbulbifer rhizosphaerae]MBB3061502.1 hypothetical protein [Microbulbifer rhizosphaerae]